jgi:hypothetical protein
LNCCYAVDRVGSHGCGRSDLIKDGREISRTRLIIA